MHYSTLSRNCVSKRTLFFIARALLFAAAMIGLEVCLVSNAGAQEASDEDTPDATQAALTRKPSSSDVHTGDVGKPAPNSALKYDREASEALTKYFNDLGSDSERSQAIRTQQKLARRSQIENVSLDQFDASWKINVELMGVPADEALIARFSEIGVSLAADPEAIQRLKQRVTLTLPECSRLKAIEEICRSVGVYPDYSELGNGFHGLEPDSDVRLIFTSPQSKTQPATASAAQVVQIRVGSRPLPITFAGPLAIEICRLTEFVPNGTGKLEVRVHAAGLPASVVACQEMRPLLAHIEAEFDAVKDQNGSLLGHDQGSYRPWFDLPSVQSQTHDIELSNLLRRSETLHVAGHVRIPVPVQVETLQLDDLTAGVGAEAGGWHLKVDASPAALNKTRNDAYQLPITLKGNSEDILNQPQQIVAFDENERALQVTSHSFWGFAANGKQLDELQGSLVLDGKPVRLICKVVVEMKTLDYPFELVAPLKSSSEQPEQRIELEFSGAAPVSIDVLELIRSEPFSKVKVRLKNYSNKDVQEVAYTMNYLDASGHELKNHRGRFSGGFSRNEAPEVGIAKASSKVSEETAFFIPANATSVEIAVGDVTFLDGSRWLPPAP